MLSVILTMRCATRNFDVTNVQPHQWGTLTFTFYDCDVGLVSWDTSATAGGSG